MKPSARPRLAKKFVEAPRRRRIIEAMTELSAERGYRPTGIADLVARAHVGRQALYESFAGKEAVLLAALDAAIEECFGRIEAATAGAGPADGKAPDAALAALLTFIAEKPAAACLWLVEALSATPASSAGFYAALEPLGALLLGYPAAAPLKPALATARVGGIVYVLQRRIRGGDSAKAPELLAPLSAFLLSP